MFQLRDYLLLFSTLFEHFSKPSSVALIYSRAFTKNGLAVLSFVSYTGCTMSSSGMLPIGTVSSGGIYPSNSLLLCIWFLGDPNAMVSTEELSFSGSSPW